MLRPPPNSTLSHSPVPYPTRFRSVCEVADRGRHIRLTRDEGLFPDRLAVAHDAAGAFDMIGERAGQQFGAERGRAQLGMREPKIIAAFGDVIGKFVGEREAEPYRRAVARDQIDARDLGLLDRKSTRLNSSH